MNDPTPSATMIVDKAQRLRAELKEELTYNQLVGEELSDEKVAALHLSLDDLQAAVHAAYRAVGEEVVRRHEARGKPIEVNGYLITTKLGYTRERCVDTPGFLHWMLQNPNDAVAAVNPNNVRFGSLPPAVRDTFFEKEQVVKPDAVPQATAIPVEVLARKKK